MGDHEFLKSYNSEGSESPAGAAEESAPAATETEAKNIELNPDQKQQTEEKKQEKGKQPKKGKVPHVALPDLTKIPHPKGSIGLILLLILILLFAVVKAPNGMSRLQLLMGAMMGKVKVGGTSADTGKPSDSSSSSTTQTTSAAATNSYTPSLTGAVR